MTDALVVSGLRSGYGGGQVLHGVELRVPQGAVVAVLGRNGVGKTTLVHTIAGLVPPTAGSVLFEGAELAGLPSHAIARRGIGLVPQGRRIFPRLTVEENLRIAVRRGRDGAAAEPYDLFPALRQRRGHRGDQLSGGEQQMLAIARGLMGSPRLLLLDEPSEGLAPLIAAEIREAIARLAGGGVSTLLVEQNLWVALDVASSVAIMVKGRIVYRATADEVRSHPGPAAALLGVSAEDGSAG
ncbi:MAG: ABC transporter ATP-binding protein [Actinomycetota bacterium]|nr:ABC transporter ATP-binding protein [Actinomycetota bacterium]